MQTRTVDPRDIAWERDDPTFRVHFWSPQEGQGPGVSTTEYEVTGTDVGSLVRWAEENKPAGGGYLVYLVAMESDGLGLYRLGGQAPAGLTT